MKNKILNKMDPACWNTPVIHLAVLTGTIEEVECLLDAGGEVDESDDLGTTALHLACAEGNVKMAEYLIDHGANMKAKDCADVYPIYFAIAKNHPEIVDLYRQKGCDLSDPPTDYWRLLYFAGLNKNIPILKKLLEFGFTQTGLPYVTKIFCSACYHGNVDIVNFLLKKGISVTCRTINNRTPLHLAYLGGHDKIVELLLDYGADPRTLDDEGNTPIDLANKKLR